MNSGFLLILYLPSCLSSTRRTCKLHVDCVLARILAHKPLCCPKHKLFLSPFSQEALQWCSGSYPEEWVGGIPYTAKEISNAFLQFTAITKLLLYTLLTISLFFSIGNSIFHSLGIGYTWGGTCWELNLGVCGARNRVIFFRWFSSSESLVFVAGVHVFHHPEIKY